MKKLQYLTDTEEKLKNNAELLAKSHIEEIKRFWEKASSEQKQESKLNRKNISHYFSETISKMRIAKKNFKLECKQRDKIIHAASNAYMKDHDEFYGRGFTYYPSGIEKYINENEKRTLKDDHFKNEYIRLSKEFNNSHIAWSLLHGKKISQILPNFQNNYFVDWGRISNEMKFFTDQLCPSEKLFVFVRKDLSKIQQAIQAGHAVAEWCKFQYEYKQENPQYCCWENGKLIYFQISGIKELKDLFHRIKNSGQKVVAFHDISRHNEMTSIASLTNNIDKFKPCFKDFDLMRL